MLRQKVRRLANPRRRKRVKAKAKTRRRRVTRRAKRSNPPKRRKRVVAVRRRRKVHTRKRNRRRARRNPALVVTLGALGNPHKRKRRKKVMATRRRRKARRNPARRRRARRNTRIVVVAPRRRRRANSHRRRNARRVHHRRRRNPSVFGHSGIRNIGTVVLGGLVGVAAAKFIPTLVPAQMQLGGGNVMRTVITGAAAFAAHWVAKRFMPTIADAVLFGGLMQTASVGLNAFLPSLGRQIGLNGMGYLADGAFVVPQNPLRLPPPAPTPTGSRITVNGLHRAMGVAF